MPDATREKAMTDAITALEIAAELPTAQRCQAFIRAFIAEETWAVRDVEKRRADITPIKDTPDAE